MKTKSFKLYSLGAGLLLVLIVSAYWAKSDADTKAFSIPQLLDRNERIMLGQEWDEVQRRYM